MKNTGRIILSALALFLFGVLCSCGGAARAGTRQNVFYAEVPAAAGGPSVSAEMASPADIDFSAGENPLSEIPGQTRKLIKNAYLHLRVDNLDASAEPLLALMEKYDAWAASTGIHENSRNYTIRVPAASYDPMLAELEGLGRLLGRTENAEDVSFRYYDLESRLATKRELLKTYQGYLAGAANIDEIMTVESRIAELQLEIDQTGTQFRNLVSRVDYSTITVELAGPAALSAYAEPAIGDKLGELFGSFGGVASSVLVGLLGIIIYGVPAVLVLALLFWLLFGRVGLLKKLFRLAAGKTNP